MRTQRVGLENTVTVRVGRLHGVSVTKLLR